MVIFLDGHSFEKVLCVGKHSCLEESIDDDQMGLKIRRMRVFRQKSKKQRHSDDLRFGFENGSENMGSSMEMKDEGLESKGTGVKTVEMIYVSGLGKELDRRLGVLRRF